ncbi:MAG: bi-domain-containing oxidoreductase [Flavipsychrobacter sp.]|nr:bi-domain-containing oxidoreductase [Flavipsychrobacter sp.]
MKQIIQDLKNGDTILEEVPAPMPRNGYLLIRTSRSLISLGTERMLVEFGKAGWIQKARQQPDRVKMVLNKIKTDGLKPTVNAVFNKLGQPIPLGYCNVGRVIAVGKGVTGFQVGDRVASNGHHAEIVSVPQNLAARVPDNVSDEEAAFTVIGAIGLQGIRLVAPTFGETIVVIGMGLIGQLTAQLLKANGCRVVGVDFDNNKLELARARGIITINPAEGTDPVAYINALTQGIGADGVVITAANKDNEIISQSAQMSRKRGRIVLVGVVGLDINRADFFEKELSFQVSCSYGPGRYDTDYEQKGLDYPVGFVRWTEKRNFEAVLQALDSRQLDVQPLITDRIGLYEYHKAYGNMQNPNAIATIITYSDKSSINNTVVFQSRTATGGSGVAGIIGAGNFTGGIVLPALKKCGAGIKVIASASGLSGVSLAKKYGIAAATTDYKAILADTDVEVAFITTRHHQHAHMVCETLEAGKHVFVEKPLAIHRDELAQVIDAYKAAGKTLTVGYNRRFAPLAVKMKKLLGETNAPMNIVVTINAGMIPAGNWLQDMETGGGRIIGEACHFIDLCTYLCGSAVKAVCLNAMGTHPAENTDNATLLLQYENGTHAAINYFSNGSKAYDKERVEVYSQERTLVLENWKRLKGYGFRGFSSESATQDKGHYHQFRLLMERIKNGGEPVIPFHELVNTSQASLAAIESLKQKAWITL